MLMESGYGKCVDESRSSKLLCKRGAVAAALQAAIEPLRARIIFETLTVSAPLDLRRRLHRHLSDRAFPAAET
jgi:hypothetical protein